MTNSLKMAFIIAFAIGVVFVILFAIAGFGSVQSSTGHFLKNTLQGTSLEQSAASIESAGNDLTTKAHGAIALFTGVLVLCGLAYVGSKT